MNRTAAASLAALALLVAPDARAADDAETEALRRDVDALVRRIETYSAVDADSPTAIVNRLLAAGEPKLRPVLEEAWRIAAARSAGDEDRGESVRWIVRFLYGRVSVHDSDEPIVGSDGVVRIRPGDGQPAMMGPWLAHPPSPPTFAQLVDGGKLRAPSRPWAAPELLAELPKAAHDDDFARALGEACASDAVSRGRLLALVDAECLEPSPFTAVAWTRAPEAVKLLCDHLPRLATVALSDNSPPAPLRAACRGLVHADRDALAAAIAKLPDTDQQEAAWGDAGLDVAQTYFVAWLDSAETPAARSAVLRRIAAILGDRGQISATTSVATIFARLVTEIDRGDGVTRDAAMAAVEALLGGGTGPLSTSGSWSDSSGSRSHSSVGEEVRPYPDVAVALRTWKTDLAAGRIAFAAPRPSAFDGEAQPPTRLDAEVLSDVAHADVFVLAPSVPAPGSKPTVRVAFAHPGFSDAKLHLRGAFVADGLALTLTNMGDADVSIDPVALRYVAADVMDEKVSATGAEPRAYRRMNLYFGRTLHAAVVDAEVLVVLAPGKSFSWTTPVRRKDRDVDHVVVSMEYGVRVRGKPPAPLVTQFRDVWVK